MLLLCLCVCVGAWMRWELPATGNNWWLSKLIWWSKYYCLSVSVSLCLTLKDNLKSFVSSVTAVAEMIFASSVCFVCSFYVRFSFACFFFLFFLKIILWKLFWFFSWHLGLILVGKIGYLNPPKQNPVYVFRNELYTTFSYISFRIMFILDGSAPLTVTIAVCFNCLILAIT